MTRAGGRAFLLALPLALLIPNAAIAGARTDLRFFPAFFTGDFGGDSDTDVLYVPTTAAILGRRAEFRLTIPYLSVRSEVPFVIVGGEVIPLPGTGPATESGPGDVILQGEYFFKQGDARRAWASLLGRVKAPTADDTNGLGTGEFDYGVGTALIKPLAPTWSLLLQALYIFRGDPEWADFRDTLWISAGTQARPNPDHAISIFYESRQSAVGGREAARDLSLEWDRRLGGTFTIRSALYVGLSETAEDWGAALGLSYRTAATAAP